MSSIRFQKGNFITVPNKSILRGMPAPSQCIYMWICDHSNSNGECFPSNETLAEESGTSIRTVIDHVKCLVAAGILKKGSRTKKDGGNASNVYTIVLQEATDLEYEKTTAGGGAKSFDGGAGAARYTVQLPHHIYNEVSINNIHKELLIPIAPSIQDSPPPSASASPESRTERITKKNLNDEEVENGFIQFWDFYPRHDAKKVAIKSWRKLKLSVKDLPAILTSLEKYKNTKQWKERNGQFIPYASTWLNQERWKDDLTSPSQKAFSEKYDSKTVSISK